MMLLAQFSDPHIREPGRLAYRRLDTAPYLEAAVDALRRLPQTPDAVVITGDLCDTGRAAEYEHLRNLLKPLAMPVYLMPGNHDDRAQMRRAFPEHACLGQDGFVQYSVAIGELQLIALDSVVPGQPYGELCAERLAWLAGELEKNRDRAVVIALHHPPFKTLIGHMDDIGLRQGSAALEALVAAHANVERIVCGHLHRPIQVRFGGAVALTVPSTAHQVTLDIDPAAASSWMLEPPGFGLHALPRGGRMVSHTAACGVYQGPYPFHEGGQLID